MINVCNIHAPRLGLWSQATRILKVHCVRLLIDESPPPDHHMLTFEVGGGHIHQSQASVFGDLSAELTSSRYASLNGFCSASHCNIQLLSHTLHTSQDFKGKCAFYVNILHIKQDTFTLL